MSNVEGGADTDSELQALAQAKSESDPALKINLSSHYFDPFDVLPVPGSQRLDTLFKLRKSRSNEQRLATSGKPCACRLTFFINRWPWIDDQLRCHQRQAYLEILRSERCRTTPCHISDLGTVRYAKERIGRTTCR